MSRGRKLPVIGSKNQSTDRRAFWDVHGRRENGEVFSSSEMNEIPLFKKNLNDYKTNSVYKSQELLPRIKDFSPKASQMQE